MIDDIHVIEDPDGLNRELIQNGTFESDWIGASPSKWRIMENHHGTVIDDPDNPGSNKVLHLRTTGRHDIVSNLAEKRHSRQGTRSLPYRTAENMKFRCAPSGSLVAVG